MIVYSATKTNFLNDVFDNNIEDTICDSLVREAGIKTGVSQKTAFKNSLGYMDRILSRSSVPDDAWIAIEYKIPFTSKRIDFIVTGKDEDKKPIAIVIELKQWQSAEITDSDGMVKTVLGGGIRETQHPSYQAWSYTTLIEDYNEDVREKKIKLQPCAYLHNYERDDVIENDFYKEYVDKAPVFLREDAKKLQKFLEKFVKYGDNKEVLYTIEDGKIKPSKALAESLFSMLNGNKEFILIDDQKSVYEKALKLARESTAKNKNVLIVQGGPGTGKSVVAINLLSKLTSQEKLVKYITKNSAPREVFKTMLTGKFTKSRIDNLFGSTGGFYDVEKNIFDVLVVDEAHRLNLKSGLYQNLGDNQIEEIIKASKFSIFFIDEDQRVTIKDIGRKSEIKKYAKKIGVNIVEMELQSQFRCNGSDGYLAWVDNALQIRETANIFADEINYDIRVYDDPQKMHDDIILKNTNNKARVVAGYCWKWISKKDQSLRDIQISNYGAKWNLASHGQSWIIRPDSATEVGCIHTCQGLEVEYIGVIIGPDLIVRDGNIITRGLDHPGSDKALSGFRSILRESPDKANKIANTLIRNTYRTLMTRGMKGCYIYCTDPETRQYFKEKLIKSSKQDIQYGAEPGESINFDK